MSSSWLLAVALACVGCQFERPADVLPVDATDGDANASGVRIAPLSATWLRLDGETTIAVVLERDAGFDGPVTISLRDPAPSGLVADPVVVPSGRSVASVVLRAVGASGARAGDEPDVQLIAATAQGETSANVEVLIAGPPGTVDERFGVVGVAVAPVAAAGGFVRQGDRIVVAGDDRLWRWTRDGAVDTTFGAGGQLVPVFDRMSEVGRVYVAGLASGRLLLVGNGIGQTAGREDVFFQRVTLDGQFDPTYLETGDSFTESFSVAMVAVGPGDSVFVGGLAWQAGENTVMVRKYDDRGRRDATFGQGGSITLDYATSHNPPALVVTSDGGVIVSVKDADFALHMSRWSATGQPVAAFGVAGEVLVNTVLSAQPVFPDLQSLGVRNDAEVWVAGMYTLASPLNAEGVLVRFNENGLTDAAFGANGVWSVMRADADLISSVVELGDGSLLVAGGTSPTLSGPLSGRLYHLTASGQPIPDVGPAGAAELDFPFAPTGFAFVEPSQRAWYLAGFAANQLAVTRIWY